MWFEVRSRSGNAILGGLGVVYLVAALVLLVLHVVQTWGAASMLDRVVQAVLVLSAAAGMLFVSISARNLGFRLLRRASPLHQEGAAAVR